MKHLLIFIILCTFIKIANAQSTSPLPSNEYCPGVDNTFTVTIPGSNPNVISWTNAPVIIQQAYNISGSTSSTTFNFKGRFNDANIAQVFRVNYKDANSVDATYDIVFKKIKSLFYPTCTSLQPNQPTIPATRCQSQNFSITFNNVQWRTAFESH